jgi:hypothetical protein
LAAIAIGVCHSIVKLALKRGNPMLGGAWSAGDHVLLAAALAAAALAAAALARRPAALASRPGVESIVKAPQPALGGWGELLVVRPWWQIGTGAKAGISTGVVAIAPASSPPTAGSLQRFVASRAA